MKSYQLLNRILWLKVFLSDMAIHGYLGETPKQFQRKITIENP